jgi:hypothetical protein
MSTVLLGQRRMGKTEIFKRVVNRLFFEQESMRPDISASVVPVYYKFSRTPQPTPGRLPEEVRGKFLRWYAGFRLRTCPTDCFR